MLILILKRLKLFEIELEEKLLAIEEARREQEKNIRRAPPNEFPISL